MNIPLAHILAERDYPRELLESAKEMILRGRYEIAVVTAQMACKICAERVLRTYFRFKEITFLEKAIEDLLPSYNLANEKVRRVYFALSGDAIHQQYFWTEYKTMVNIRNKAVHAGTRIQQSQAQMVCRIASSVVKHLQAVEQRAVKPMPEQIEG